MPNRAIRIPGGVQLAIAWIILMMALTVLGMSMPQDAVLNIDLVHRLQPPLLFGGNSAFVLGTDELGRDMAARLIKSIEVSVGIAFCATLIGLLIGTVAGFVAAEARGVVDQLVQSLIDFQASVPFLIIALTLLAFFGNSIVLFIGLMSLHGWERHARVARSMAMEANALGYASAVRQLGASTLRVYALHILPNIAGPLIVSASLAFPEIILLESGLSFLGLGVQPPMTSLGAMVGFGRDYIDIAPWMVLLPSAAILLTTLSINLLGDWLQDWLAPRRQ